MKYELIKYLEDFEQRLHNILFEKCMSLNVISDKRLPEAEEIMGWWKENAPFFMEDAVKEFNGYPTVVLAWASFLGMAIAALWDKDWENHKNDTYMSFYGTNGFDDMDENIMENYLGITPDSGRWMELSDILRSVSNEALNFIRHENIEGATEKAFHVMAKSLKLMFSFGAAIELYKLGYKWKKIN